MFTERVGTNRGDTYANVRARMLSDSRRDSSYSFLAHMRRILGKGDFQNPRYFLTANSAIPVADAIRGVYDGVGVPEPQIDYILMNRDLSKPQMEIDHRKLGIEKDRLQGLLSKSTREFDVSVVIDQMVDSKATLLAAKRMLQDVGVDRVHIVPGNWYFNVLPVEINEITMTSRYRPFMYDVGRIAAERL